MTHHHPHDGCHGEDRDMSPEDREAVSDAMARMMLGVASKDFPAAMRAGAYVGVHYGPNGEWLLALSLIRQVLGLAPLDDCDDNGVPVITKALPPGDERARLMTVHCLAQFPEGRDHTVAEVDAAVASAGELVTRFLDHYKHDRKDDCYAVWEAMYEMTYTESETTRENTFRAAACSALLACWAAHYSAIRIGA